MGIDAYIFDAVSKECLYIDKEKFLREGFSEWKKKVLDDLEAIMLSSIFARLKDPVYYHSAGLAADIPAAAKVTSAEVIQLADSNPEWGYMAAIRHFALERPDGRFFVISDHDDPNCHEFIKDDHRGQERPGAEYVEVKPDFGK